jgi:hypothetical protein
MKQLAAKDLRLLGSYYQSSTRLVTEVQDDHVCLVPRKLGPFRTAFTIGGPAIVCSVLFVLGWPGAWRQLGFITIPLFAFIGLLATCGPVASELLRYRYLQKHTPLLQYSRSTEVVSILAGASKFPLADVCCLLGVSIPGSSGKVMSELQLLTIKDGTFTPHLLCTAFHWSAKRCFGKVMSEIADQTPLRILYAEVTGITGKGPVQFTTRNGETSVQPEFLTDRI